MRALLLALCLAWPSVSSADEVLFDSCNILYQASSYEDAAGCYESLVAEGVHNGPLHHNLGNALLHLDRHGEAIYHYRQAQVFQPRDSELRSHLAKARAAAEVGEPDPRRTAISQLLFFHDSLSPGELWATTAALNLVLWTLLCIRLFRKGEILTWSAGVFAAATLMFGVAAAHKHVQLVTQPTAVVVTGTATGRSGMDRASSEMFRLPEGVEVTVLARLDRWCEVELATGNRDGTRGWVETSSLGVIEYGWLGRVRNNRDIHPDR